MINPADATWDVDLVKSIFWPIDVPLILQIPITPGREDLVAWHFNRNGIFSVRSTYHCQWESKFGPRCNSMAASGAARSQAWKRMWKLQIQGKIKIFGWRVLHGFIPCWAILTNWHIRVTGGCPMCQHGAEDIKHLLFTCDRAKAIWSMISIWGMIASLLGIDRS